MKPHQSQTMPLRIRTINRTNQFDFPIVQHLSANPSPNFVINHKDQIQQQAFFFFFLHKGQFKKNKNVFVSHLFSLKKTRDLLTLKVRFPPFMSKMKIRTGFFGWQERQCSGLPFLQSLFNPPNSPFAAQDTQGRSGTRIISIHSI